MSAGEIGPSMAGPGIRALELGRSLGSIHEIRVLAPRVVPGLDGPPTATWRADDPGGLDRHLAWAEVVVAPPLAPRVAERIVASGRPWIADLYNPEPFEGLGAHPGHGERARRALDALRTDRLSFAARSAAAFVCAGDRQRDMWLGYLAASRRVTSRAATDDPLLRRLVRVVGCGVPDAPPAPAAAPVVRGVSAPPDARLVVWNGGLWPWLDVATVVTAVSRVRTQDPRVRLVLAPGGPGDRHAATVAASIDDARDRLGDGLVLLPGWVPYERRGDLLLEADAGVCAHLGTVEARFAERVRLLDLLWAGTPVVTTAGDPLAELVATRALGATVPPGDPEAFAAALAATLVRGRGAVAAAAAEVAEERRWGRVAVPLAELVADVAGRRPPRRDLVARALGWRHRVADGAVRLTGRG